MIDVKYEEYDIKKDSEGRLIVSFPNYNPNRKIEPQYVIYATDTVDGNRALYYRRGKIAAYSSEANAEKFSESEADKIISNIKNGKHTWSKKRVI